jgi:hypothetical protein
MCLLNSKESIELRGIIFDLDQLEFNSIELLLDEGLMA